MSNLGLIPTSIEGFLSIKITWQATGDVDFPLEATILGKKLALRLNDFPAEPLYTLFVDGKPLDSLDDWPKLWVRPALPQRPKL